MTGLKKERSNKKAAASHTGVNGSRKEYGDEPADWKLIKKGATMTSPDDGKKYVWCQYHGPNNGKSGKQSGMYILAPHNHTKWLANRKKKVKAWKGHHKERNSASNKCKVSFETGYNADSNTEKRGNNIKLALANIFKSVLVAKVQISYTEVRYILDTSVANANKYYDDNSEN